VSLSTLEFEWYRSDAFSESSTIKDMKTRTVEPKSLRFSGYLITSINITEKTDGTVTKIQLWCKEGPLASALTEPCHRNNLVVKDYSENEGLLDVLTDGKIVEINDLGFCRLLV
jgi:hypothetical protein